MGWNFGWGGYPQHVTVGERRSKAAQEIAKLRKKGQDVSPVVLGGTAIAKTYWGKAWCKNLERYSDYANRLPRGRSYVRSGAVVDLKIEPGKVKALVRGTALYSVEVSIAPVDQERWRAIVKECAGGIGSVIELLKGKLSRAVMEVISRERVGLFPTPKQIRMRCSCPDAATLCKHVAATLYGVGARFDEDPELLFRLSGVDAADLVSSAAARTVADKGKVAEEKVLDGDLASVFGIDLGPASPSAKAPAPAAKAPARSRRAAPPTITGADLAAAGVPKATVGYWLKTGVLARTAAAGVYGRTEVLETRLKQRAERIADERAQGLG